MLKKIFEYTFICLLSLTLSACAATTRAEPVAVKYSPAYAPAQQTQPKAETSSIFRMDRDEVVAPTAPGQSRAAYYAPTGTRKTGNPYEIKGVTYYPLDDVAEEYEEIGVASWYGEAFHGKQTANGEIYDMHSMSAAHKTLPMPTYVQVTNLENNRSVVVRVNDRGPFSKGRVIDLSYAAAKGLGIIEAGTAKVHLTVLSQSNDHLRTEGRDVDINTGIFGVQIGSFADVGNANSLAARHESAVVIPTVVGGRTYYRVQVQGFATRQEAAEAVLFFERKYTGAFLVAK